MAIPARISADTPCVVDAIRLTSKYSLLAIARVSVKDQPCDSPCIRQRRTSSKADSRTTGRPDAPSRILEDSLEIYRPQESR